MMQEEGEPRSGPTAATGDSENGTSIAQTGGTASRLRTEAAGPLVPRDLFKGWKEGEAFINRLSSSLILPVANAQSAY